MTLICQVLIPSRRIGLLDYFCPLHLETDIQVFQLVLVPLKSQLVTGLVFKIKTTMPSYDYSKMKYIDSIIEQQPVFSSSIYLLYLWFRSYYLASLQDSIKFFIPRILLQKKNILQTYKLEYVVASTKYLSKLLTPAQQRAMTIIGDASEACDILYLKSHKISTVTITNLLQKGYLLVKKSSLLKNPNLYHKIPSITLPSQILWNKEQAQAIQSIYKNISSFNIQLLYGVPGSGKTEIYCAAMEKVLAQGLQVLVMVPEINLTKTLARYFEKKLNYTTTIIHSRISHQARYNTFLEIQQKAIQIIICTRTGIFYDIPALALIIVDEEHDHSFKENRAPRYNAKHLAIIKAKQLNIPIILGSATPSLESFYNVEQGKYQLLKLTQRALNSNKNTIKIIDMNASKISHNLSETLLLAIQSTLDKQEQVLLFINKLGFARMLFCKECNWIAICLACNLPYSVHYYPSKYLFCYSCKKKAYMYLNCLNCHSDKLITRGQGTEKIEQIISQIFPQARIGRLDSSIKNVDQVLDDIHNKKLDIIIGTQIIAKGHDFQSIGLVGILSIDSGLLARNWHCVEYIAQLVHQVSGRAARLSNIGVIYIQTYIPHHPILQKIINDSYDQLAKFLLDIRQELQYPPFKKNTYIYGESRSLNQCFYDMQLLRDQIIQQSLQLENIEQTWYVSEIMPTIQEKKAYQYRCLIIIESYLEKSMQTLLKPVQNYRSRRTRIFLDRDPLYIE